MKVKLEDHHIEGKGKFEFVTIDAPDWIVIVPETSDNNLIMVQQYRPGWEAISIEFPAGRLETGEDFTKAASRELREETGYKADKFNKCIDFRPVVWTNQNCSMYIANELEHVGQDLDNEEQIEVLELKPDKIEEMIENGSIKHGITIMAYYYWKNLQNIRK